jgi:hypothetical protein
MVDIFPFPVSLRLSDRNIECTRGAYVGLRDPIRYVFNNASSVTLLASLPIPVFDGEVQSRLDSTVNSRLEPNYHGSKSRFKSNSREVW